MKYAIIENLPNNPKEIFDEALFMSYHCWIDEKGTKDNPEICKRKPSKLNYEEAFKIIQNNKPHWTVYFRNQSALFAEKDYWEFGGCNIGSSDYGEVFIWVCVEPKIAEKIFERHNLKVKEY